MAKRARIRIVIHNGRAAFLLIMRTSISAGNEMYPFCGLETQRRKRLGATLLFRDQLEAEAEYVHAEYQRV